LYGLDAEGLIEGFSLIIRKLMFPSMGIINPYYNRFIILGYILLSIGKNDTSYQGKTE
jgi:hypothetical protein